MSDVNAGGGTMMEFAREESLALLATAQVGRLVFTKHALPAIRPVNFVLDDDEVVVRTRPGSKLLPAVAGNIVAFEADEIDPDHHEAWSVIVTGPARLVTDPQDIRYLRDVVHPWVASPEGTYFIRIRPEIVSGRRIRRLQDGHMSLLDR